MKFFYAHDPDLNKQFFLPVSSINRIEQGEAKVHAVFTDSGEYQIGQEDYERLTFDEEQLMPAIRDALEGICEAIEELAS